jgi:bisphosphoglycerate-dependent phosphoglycerate mutase
MKLIIAVVCVLYAARPILSDGSDDYVTCQDGKTLPKVVAGSGEKSTAKLENMLQIRLIFIRHADSTWNKKKNAGPLSYIHGFFQRTLGQFDDAGLSKPGIDQAVNLANAIKSHTRRDPDWDVILNKKPETRRIFATSNLKRAPMTLLIAFQSQLDKLKESGVHVLSSLQEASTGRDAKSNSEQGGSPHIFPSGLTGNNQQCPLKSESLDELFHTESNKGDHAEASTNLKIKTFCEWMEAQVAKELKKKMPPKQDVSVENEPSQVQSVENSPVYLIVAGHSSWLRDFFRAKLDGYKEVKEKVFFMSSKRREIPNGASGIEKRLLEGNKLFNTGMIATTIKLGGAKNLCQIVQGSTRLLYSAKEATDKGDGEAALVDKTSESVLDYKYRPTSVVEYEANVRAHQNDEHGASGSSTASTSPESISSD